MGVRDDVIATMQSSVRQARERLADCKPVGKGKEGDLAVSVSQQYKMAGNSIVVDVLAALSSRYDAWGGLRDNHGQHTIVLVAYE